MSENKITTNEFFELILIQTKIYEQNHSYTDYIFNKGINLFNIEDKELAVKTDDDLDRILRKKAQNWMEKEGFLIGLDTFKQIYWNGYFRALIPYLIHEYLNRGFSAKDLQNEISAQNKGKGVNDYLFEKYPKLRDILRFQAQSYKEMLIELDKKGIKQKLGYNKVPDDVEEFKIIPKSVIVDLMEQIERTKNEIKDKDALELIKIYKGTMTQKEIGKKIGMSQQKVSRLLNESKM